MPPVRSATGATGFGAGLVALIVAGGLALSVRQGEDPGRCRGVTRFTTPALVALAGEDCGTAEPGTGRTGTVSYLADGQCFVLAGHDADHREPALIVWPAGSRPVAGARPSVFVPDRAAGDAFHGGNVTVGNVVEGLGPANLAGIDRVSPACRRVVGDRVVAMSRVRLVP